ncbi:MAG: RES family NAD+ phosphorylase [Flavobacteriaceae bacterium]|nr:RES family NAD+ phosphorylase [Flavobacteriaceae bacterium]
MKIYRIAKQKFINDLSGEGARLYGGRWNKKGCAMLYFSEHLSLCVLEMLVHTNQQLITNNYFFFEVEIPVKHIKTILENKLPINWRSNNLISETQVFGSNWLQNNKDLALRIPSAVLPSESNILINPNHIQFSKIKVIKVSELNLDARL